MLDPNAPTIRRLTVARVLLFFVAVASAALAATRPSDILAMVGWAFSLAMAGNFPALVLRHLVETRHHDRRDLRDHRRVGHLPVLPRDLEVFPAGGRYLLRHDVAAEPGDRQGPDQCRPGHGRSEMARRRAGERGKPAGQQGRLVRPQQHQLRIAGHAARLPGDRSWSACMGKAPSKEMQALIDEIRKPRGRTVLEEKTA